MHWHATGFPMVNSLYFRAVIPFLWYLLTTTVPAEAACNKDPTCDDISAWLGFNRVVLKQSYSGSGESYEWVALFDYETKDILIDVTTKSSDLPTKGTVALIGGRIMMSRELELKPGYEIDALDAPVLSIQLLLRVLNRISPQGPDAITDSIAVEKTFPVGIKFATPSASGFIPPPWHVEGNLNRLSDGKIRYELALAFPMAQRGDPLHDKPAWRDRATGPPGISRCRFD